MPMHLHRRARGYAAYRRLARDKQIERELPLDGEPNDGLWGPLDSQSDRRVQRRSLPRRTNSPFRTALGFLALEPREREMRLLHRSLAVMTGNLTNSVLSLLDGLLRNQPLMEGLGGRWKETLSLVVGFSTGCVAAAAVSLLGD